MSHRRLDRRLLEVSHGSVEAFGIVPNVTIGLDTVGLWASFLCVTSRELLRLLRAYGCVEVRQKGSHVMVRCGKCQTVVPVHPGEDIKPGTLHSIERALEPCLGKDWLKR